MAGKKMSQKEFADKLREKLPELQQFSDSQIVNRIIKMRPDLTDSIDMGNDAAAAKEQAKLEKRSRSIIDPESWTNPTGKGFAKGILDALPGAGAIFGGLAATPETLGGGTIAGGALGAGAGRGLADLASQYLGLEDTSPLDKAKNIAMDTGVTAVTPGAMTIAKYPWQATKLAASDLLKTEGMLIPKGLRPFMTPGFLEKLGASAPKTPISDPISSRIAELMEEGLGPQGGKNVAGKLPIRTPELLPSGINKFAETAEGQLNPTISKNVAGIMPQGTPELSLPEGGLDPKYLNYLEQKLTQLSPSTKGLNTAPSDNLYDLWKTASEAASQVTGKATSDPLKTLESKVIQQSSKKGGWNPIF